jgi:hypothetical protein
MARHLLLSTSGMIPRGESCMRKLSVMVAALFLLGSAPAFAQTSGGAASGTSESGAMGADGGAADAGAKKSTKKSKKHKKEHKDAGAAGADAGM